MKKPVNFPVEVKPEIENYWYILEEAIETAKEREKVYGSYIENHERIVMQCARLGLGISRQDVYKVMIAVKLSRIEQSPDHKDSYLDLVNYCSMLLADGLNK